MPKIWLTNQPSVFMMTTLPIFFHKGDVEGVGLWKRIRNSTISGSMTHSSMNGIVKSFSKARARFIDEMDGDKIPKIPYGRVRTQSVVGEGNSHALLTVALRH